MDKQELQKAFNEYLATLDDNTRDEWRVTVRGLHTEGLDAFLAWAFPPPTLKLPVKVFPSDQGIRVVDADGDFFARCASPEAAQLLANTLNKDAK